MIYGDRRDDPLWRICWLYKIIDKEGRSVSFRPNHIQKHFLSVAHKRKIVLKARQLGMSTLCVLQMLDDVIFTPNLSAGIVSYSVEHAKFILKRIVGHALHELKEKPCRVTGQSAREISFSNGSILRVDTSLRGGTYPSTLVSEFGKTCARDPLKAEEVITGTLNAVPIGGKSVIESTGEGNEGYFADLVHTCATRGNENLTPLDYYLFFYPWFSEPTYSMREPIEYGVELTDYFNKIEIETNTKISKEQRFWYAAQKLTLGDKIRQEFPSTVSEAFISSSDAYYYSQCVERAYSSNRCIGTQLYDPLAPVYLSFDIGVNDLTVILFFQVIHGEIRIIDLYFDNGKGVDFYARYLLQDKPYVYSILALPHDAGHRDGIIVENTYQREFSRLFAHTQTKVMVLPRNDKNLGISHAKIKFDRCVFALQKVKPLLDHLMKYRKKWSEATGRYLDEPFHDIHSNFADCFRYAMQLVTHIEAGGGISGAMDKHKQAVESRRNRL